MCEGKAFFSFTSSFTLEIWKNSILQKNRIYLFLSRRQLQKMRSFRPKAFTQKSLIHNHLRKMSEEVKAKNGKLLCAHYARARPPHLHSEHRALHLLAARTRHHEIRPPLGAPPLCPLCPIFSTKITGKLVRPRIIRIFAVRILKCKTDETKQFFPLL